MENRKKLYLYPLWLRIWHNINAIGIVVLIYSGITLHYSATGGIFLNFKSAIISHNIAGIIVSANFIIVFIGNIFSKNGRHYRLKVRGVYRRMRIQLTFYIIGFFKGEKTPFPVKKKRKFNPLQKNSYIVIVYIFLPVLIVTGVALLYPEIIFEKFFGVSGIMLTAVLHSIAGFLVFIFLIIHIYAITLGKSIVDDFKSIITGWHHV